MMGRYLANPFLFAVAAARFGERVVMNVNSSLLRTFRESELQSLLDDHFNIFSSGESHILYTEIW